MTTDNTIIGYFGGWIDKKKRIGILRFKSYPDIEEQRKMLKDEEIEK